MRKALLALFGLLLTTCAARGQGSWADKMFKEGTTHDFGNVARGAQLLHRFKITNIYAVRLEILPPRTSCGCVTVTPSVRSLEPRQEATIEVFMDARRFTGAKKVSVYITVGPEFVSTATLEVSANARPDVVFNPGQVDFSIVPRGQSRTQTIDVEYAGTLDWKVLEVVAGNPALHVSVSEKYRRPGQVGYSIQVELKPDAPAGTIKQELQLKTNDPASLYVPLLVEGTVQAPLTVAPSVVTFGTRKVGEEASQKVFIRGQNQPFRVLAIDGLSDGLSADLPPMPAAVQFVTIKLRGLKPGELNRQLHIRTDVPGEAPIPITVTGRVD